MLAQRTRSLAQSRILCAARRSYATSTEYPRPPPIEEPRIQTFSEPSKPRLYYTRPPQRSELPRIKKRWPFILAFAALGVSGWAAFLLVAMNQERLSSSVVKGLIQAAREHDGLRAALGDVIRFEPTWYLNGDPWINGSVSLLQGNVDLSFRLKGHRGAGTLYFTSIRREKGRTFDIISHDLYAVRFRVICDDGTVINLLPRPSDSGAQSQ
ncbi:cytochrome oxidase complex assembly protein 1-domain-containing protein [Melanogaster broomeanus]|nr:cytochrome oxidase complex assembly protein 1-domain-containing protein [Melanogaster broomeanus]